MGEYTGCIYTGVHGMIIAAGGTREGQPSMCGMRDRMPKGRKNRLMVENMPGCGRVSRPGCSQREDKNLSIEVDDCSYIPYQASVRIRVARYEMRRKPSGAFTLSAPGTPCLRSTPLQSFEPGFSDLLGPIPPARRFVTNHRDTSTLTSSLPSISYYHHVCF